MEDGVEAASERSNALDEPAEEPVSGSEAGNEAEEVRLRVRSGGKRS